jgi:hypothetical protein
MQKHVPHETGFLIILTLMLVSSTLTTMIPSANTQPQTQKLAKIAIEPAHIEVGQEGVYYSSENPTEPFTVKVNVYNVEDLYAWQVNIWYLPSILGDPANISMKFPPGHVFEGKQFVEGIPPTIDRVYWPKVESFVNLTDPINSTWILYNELGQPRGNFNLTGWVDRDLSGDLSVKDFVNLEGTLYQILSMKDLGHGKFRFEIEHGYIVWGASLQGDEPTFSGNGTLCQINFDGAIRAGESPLNILITNTFDTILYNNTLGKIPYETSSATVTVLGIALDPSEITIEANPKKVTVGDIITISGEIKPEKINTPVEILYKRNETGAEWKTLAKVTTGIDGKYTYQWPTNQTGKFNLKSKWEGDADHMADESPEILVEITAEAVDLGPGLNIMLYIIAAVIAVIIIAGIVIYIKKFRS